jgi:hypothetical protein
LKCRHKSKLSNICLPNGLPLQYLVLENPKISSFLLKYDKENIAAVNAFIKSPYYTLIKCDESMPTVAFLGSIGGILGLCMDLSIISIFEIFYHLEIFFHQLLALLAYLPQRLESNLKC